VEAYLTEERLLTFIDGALAEDIGPGDFSSLAAISDDRIGKSELLIKDQGILAGEELSQRIFHRFDPSVELKIHKKDGENVSTGDIVFSVVGQERTLLSCERLVLNCMQRMSGIATYTHKLQSMIEHTGARVLDTRKTTPNFRVAEKWAVKIGGGGNHRFALYDMIMLKDNHIDFCGGVKQALERTHKYLRENKLHLKIEMETRSLREVEEVLETGGVNRIMLDNMSLGDMKLCVEKIGNQAETEASGGITEKNIVSIAETGVDFISIGALTHSYQSLDMSLKAVIE
jgi:nicotinate-nucleotide pyrophosphorylase (carboxylating)